MLERYNLCKEFGWTPQELDQVPLGDVRDFIEVLSARRRLEEREQRAAEAKARR